MTREEFPGLQVSVSVLCNFEVSSWKVFLLRKSYTSGWSWLCRLGSGDSWDQDWVSEWKREQEDSHFFARGWFPYSRMPDVYERVAGAFGPGLGQNSDYWQPAQKRRLEGPGLTIFCLKVSGLGQLVYFFFKSNSIFHLNRKGHSWSSKPNTTCEIPVWAGLCHIPRLSAALQASILYSWLQHIQYILMEKK